MSSAAAPFKPQLTATSADGLSVELEAQATRKLSSKPRARIVGVHRQQEPESAPPSTASKPVLLHMHKETRGSSQQTKASQVSAATSRGTNARDTIDLVDSDTDAEPAPSKPTAPTASTPAVVTPAPASQSNVPLFGLNGRHFAVNRLCIGLFGDSTPCACKCVWC